MYSSSNFVRVITSISKCLWSSINGREEKFIGGVWLEHLKKRDCLENLYSITRDPERTGLPGGGLSSCGPRQKPVADSCEHVCDPLFYIKYGEFIDQPGIYQCLKTVTAPWISNIRIRSSGPSRHGFIGADRLFGETRCPNP